MITDRRARRRFLLVGPWRFAEYLFLLDLTSSTGFFPTPLVSPIECCSRDPQPPCVVEDNCLARARLELSLGPYTATPSTTATGSTDGLYSTPIYCGRWPLCANTLSADLSASEAPGLRRGVDVVRSEVYGGNLSPASFGEQWATTPPAHPSYLSRSAITSPCEQAASSLQPPLPDHRSGLLDQSPHAA